MEYKNTLNLPQTDFPMRASLVQREPERLAKWYADSLYEQIQKRREGAERFLLHDGPPFANGDVHIGTALNKILKDFILKYQTMRGKHVPYVPGWDCHGLPIEFKVTQQMRKDGNTDATPAAIRKACEEYALGFIDTQREQFKRLGVLGEWDNPYLTLNPAYEAEELRLFADLVEKGFVYRGKKPVYWSIPCRTALAEAEVEYQDHVSQSVYVKFPIVGETNMHLLIWTTTPWTLPANLAVAYNSQFDYQLIRVGEEALLVSVPLLDTVVEKCGWAGDFEILRTVQGDQLEEFEYHHPFCNRTGKLFAGDMFVDDSAGTGLVHIAPGHGQDDYNLGRNNGLPIYSPVDDSGRLARTADLPEEQQISDELVGKQILPKNGRSEANEAVIELLKAGNKLAFEEKYEHDQQCQQHFLGHALPDSHAVLGVQDAVCKQAEGEHIQQHNGDDGGCRTGDGHPCKPGAQKADQGCTGEGGPLHEQRQQPEVIPVDPAPLRLHDGEHQNQQFTGDQ